MGVKDGSIAAIGRIEGKADAMIMVPPSVEDHSHPELASLIGRTQHSPATNSTGRIKLFKFS